MPDDGPIASISLDEAKARALALLAETVGDVLLIAEEATRELEPLAESLAIHWANQDRTASDSVMRQTNLIMARHATQASFSARRKTIEIISVLARFGTVLLKGLIV